MSTKVGSKQSYLHILTHVAFAAAVVWAGLRLGPSAAFLVITAATLAWFALVGWLLVDRPLGVLITPKKRMSLSRAQMVLWSVVVLSAFATAALHNVAAKAGEPLRVGIPQEMWILVGMSVTSLVASPLLLKAKEDKNAVLAKHEDSSEAAISDMIKGEELGNEGTIDLARLQMAFFTIVILVTYCAGLLEVFSGLRGRQVIETLPGVDKGLLTLMGISHTGYLASKPVTTPK